MEIFIISTNYNQFKLISLRIFFSLFAALKNHFKLVETFIECLSWARKMETKKKNMKLKQSLIN